MEVADRLLYAPRFPLEGGGVADLILRYRVHGEEHESRPLVLVPHHYSASAASMDRLIGPGRPLDPAHQCIVCPTQLGPLSFANDTDPRCPAPVFSIGDDVRAQRALVAERFSGRPISLLVGFSMGALQAIEWAVQAPSSVARLVAIAGTAVTPDHSKPLLDALIACLIPAAKAAADSATARAAIRSHAKVIAAAAIPIRAYRDHEWRGLGYESADDFIESAIVAGYEGLSIQELICQLRKWKAHDVTRRFGHDRASALRRVRARARFVALTGDRFFPCEEIALDERLVAEGDLAVVDTCWGHYGFTGFAATVGADIDRHIAEILSCPAPAELEPVNCG